MTQTKITFSLVLFITFYLKGWEIMLGINPVVQDFTDTNIPYIFNSRFPGCGTFKINECTFE